MILNYVKLSIRLMIRNPFFTFINVMGLAIGFAVFFILWPFAASELRSDQFRKDHDRIARICTNLKWTDLENGNWEEITGLTPTHTCFELVKDGEDIVDFTRYLDQPLFDENNAGIGAEIIIAGGHDFSVLVKGEGLICADQNFFDFFGTPFLYGNRRDALREPESVVLSEHMATIFFGNRNPIGQPLKFNGIARKVTGVFEDNPHNSHLRFDIVISNAARLHEWNAKAINWEWWPHLYCKLRYPSSSLTKILHDNTESVFSIYHDENSNLRLSLFAQKMDEIAFSEHFRHDFFTSKSRLLLSLLIVVSLVIPGMAWVNYINLTIAQSNSRLKEVAVRKVSGARLSDVFLAFIFQSGLINLLAALIAITLIQLVREPFAQLFAIRILPASELPHKTVLFFILLFVSGTILTALYPAWAVVRLSCLELLGKRKLMQTRFIPSLLTTFQYSTAIVLIAWVFVVCIQLDLILKMDIGLSREYVISIDKPIIGWSTSQNIEFKSFADKVRKMPGVENVAISSWLSGDMTVSQTFFRSIDDDNLLIVDCHGVDENFIPLYDIKLLAGRNFLKDEHNDRIILSKLFIERLGFASPQDAIEQSIEIRTDSVQWKKVEIVGVISDYRVTPFFTSKNYTLNRTDRGQALTYLNNTVPWIEPHRISIKMTKDRITESIAQIQSLYEGAFPGNVFNWYFLDDNVNRHYAQQKIGRNQTLLFALLAIGVSCLGLLGMISNKAIEKTKEIGMRKILGADLHHIAYILLNTTGKQIMISIIIGIPVAWQLSQQYLYNFTEQINLRWWYFALPVMILLVIMLVSVSLTIIKVSGTNPIESLRSE